MSIPTYPDGTPIQEGDEVWYEYRDAFVERVTCKPYQGLPAVLISFYDDEGGQMRVPAEWITRIPVGCPPQRDDRDAYPELPYNEQEY